MQRRGQTPKNKTALRGREETERSFAQNHKMPILRGENSQRGKKKNINKYFQSP